MKKADYHDLQEVPHQLCDVNLPVGAEHEARLASGFGRLRHKMGQDPNHGVLVLQRAASSSPVFIILILTVPGLRDSGPKPIPTNGHSATARSCLLSPDKQRRVEDREKQSLLPPITSGTGVNNDNTTWLSSLIKA
ncbi:hypothetical protein INR49_025646 [Caranx melampygus]|nr:hypothetical protein INR49_025646 [Caranx melampygus]